MKHTPGPWRAWNSVSSVILKSWRVGESHTCEGVVRPVAVVSNENRSSEEELANATLIAAAPDLLHACGLLKDAWEKAAEDQQVDWDSLNLATEKAIEAYNKATGAIVEEDSV